MDQEDRKAAIRARMDEQIEAIAEAICNGRLPVAEQRVLRGLTAQMANEETFAKNLEATTLNQAEGLESPSKKD